tara:strand:- start:1584 stop:2138 length:555 start_codon:yes stop_codon:yes gene_type:complete
MEKTVDTLVPGEVLLVAVKAVKGNKYQMEFAEIISNPSVASSDPLTAMFNQGDPRFSTRARRAWRSGEKSAIEALLGIELGSITEGQSKELNILNPKVNGKSLKIQVIETTDADDYQKDNVETTAKKAGSEGDFLFYGGKHIYSNTKIVFTEGGDAEHTFLQADPPIEEATPAPAPASAEELSA